VIYPISAKIGTSMKRFIPLAKFPIITTNCVEQAEVAISSSLSNVSITRAVDRDRFKVQMNGINIGRISLVFNRFDTETKINTELHEDSVLFVFGGTVPFRMILDEGSVEVSQQKATLIMPGKLKKIEREEGSEAFVLRIPLSELLHHFEELIAWHHRGSIVFDYNIDLTNGFGNMLRQTMNSLFYDHEHTAQVLSNPGMLKSYENMLLNTLLHLPHNQNEKLYEDRRYQVAPGYVRRAEEYMRAHLDEPISIKDLLRICGCSRRMLFSAFQNARKYTPIEFLTEQRLQCTRGKLSKPHGETSVASIAKSFGFTHLGRFSQIYRKRFGEKPSETLQNGRLI
jgi:AraC-like DNA-binding protein